MFLWCHVRHINPVKIHPERITREEKNLSMILIMMKLNFLCEKKILARLKQKATFALMCIVTKTNWLFQFAFQIKNLKTWWICCLYLKKTSHIMCISEILTDLSFTKRRIKTKNTFGKVVCSVLVVKMCWQSIKKFVCALMVHNL